MSAREKTYALLARLHGQEMEAQAGALVSLQDEVARLEAERDALEESRRSGASVTMIEAMPYRGRFLAVMRQENQRLTGLIRDVETKIDAQRDKVLEAYREARSTEMLAEDLRVEASRVSQEAAQDEADELVLLRRIGAGY